MGQILSGDARARIGYGHENVGVAPPCTHTYPAAIGGVAHGVLQQVREDLREVIRIGARRDDRGEVELNTESPPFQRGGVELHGCDNRCA